MPEQRMYSVVEVNDGNNSIKAGIKIWACSKIYQTNVQRAGIFHCVLYSWPLGTSKTEHSNAEGAQKQAVRNADSISAWEQITITTDTATFSNIDDKKVYSSSAMHSLQNHFLFLCDHSPDENSIYSFFHYKATVKKILE